MGLRVAGMRAVMVVAGRGVILGERASEQGVHGVIGSAGAASIDVDAGLGERVLRAHAHAAAEQRINAPAF